MHIEWWKKLVGVLNHSVATIYNVNMHTHFLFLWDSDIFLHCDKTLLPRNSAAWSSWNFLGTMNGRVCVTYWLNILQVYNASPFYNVFNKEVCLSLECVNQQNLGETERPYCVTLNPPHTPEHMLLKWTTSHSVPSVAFHPELHLSFIKSKAREEYGFVEHIKVLS